GPGILRDALRCPACAAAAGTRAALTDGDRAAIREHLAELKALVQAEADPIVAAALTVFPGARIVSAGQPASWPPADASIPTSARTIEVYAAEMPTAACRCCGATAWFRAGSAWTCSTCHPSPNREPGCDDDVP